MTLKPNTLDWLRVRVARIEAEIDAMDEEERECDSSEMKGASKALDVARKALALMERAIVDDLLTPDIERRIEEACEWLEVRGWGETRKA